MNDETSLPDGLVALLERATEGRTLTVSLPPGRIVRDDDGRGEPVLWMSDDPAPDGLWAQARAEHDRSGLWPLLLVAPADGAETDFSAWEAGWLYREGITPPAAHDPAALLSTRWDYYTHLDDDPLPEAERLAVTAPYGRQWPGPAPAGGSRADADVFAEEYADFLVSDDPSVRLGLVAAHRGADALAACGWTAPTNYIDAGKVAAVVRDWERRFGVTVVAASPSELFLSVAAPPASRDEALHVAAEHFALCPDNIWQSRETPTLADYAERLQGMNSWVFWWD